VLQRGGGRGSYFSCSGRHFQLRLDVYWVIMRAARDPGGAPGIQVFQRENNMSIATETLQDLATQVGAGDHAAFRRLYAEFAPGALAAVHVDLPDLTQSMHVVRATFCEVWWMCAFDARCGTTPYDVPMWIAAIAQRRGDERRHALALIQRQIPPQGAAAFWAGLLADHDQRTHFELATMLDGHDNITLPAEPGLP
jgi:hypothetical protein